MVATVDVAVILHHAGMAALLGKAAHTGLHAHPVGKCRVEYLHEYLAHIFLHPLVEQAAEKIAPLLGTHREVGKASVTLVGCCQMASVVVLEYALHYGRKLQVVASHILEKTVKFHGIIGIVVVDHRHSVPLHSVFIEQIDAIHHLAPRRASTLGAAILIVKLLRAIDRDAHKPVIFGKKSAPLIGEHRAVGLYAVVHHAAAGILSLQFHHATIERERTHQRLAAVPAKEHFVHGLRREILLYEAFEQFVGHYVA